MRSRITVVVDPSPDGAPDKVEIYLNEAGLAKLLDELRGLSEQNDHFHMFTEDWGSDELMNRAYSPSQHVVHHLKVLFRPDEWDSRYFPHVMGEEGG